MASRCSGGAKYFEALVSLMLLGDSLTIKWWASFRVRSTDAIDIPHAVDFVRLQVLGPTNHRRRYGGAQKDTSNYDKVILVAEWEP